jgi:hypothetical protein
MQNVDALKTILGVVHHYCIRDNKREISATDWECITSYLRIPKETKYSLAIDGKELLLATDLLVVKYIHHDFYSQRSVHIKYP